MAWMSTVNENKRETNIPFSHRLWLTFRIAHALIVLLSIVFLISYPHPAAVSNLPHQSKMMTFVWNEDQMRTISAVWSSWGPSPQLRTFMEALHAAVTKLNLKKACFLTSSASRSLAPSRRSGFFRSNWTAQVIWEVCQKKIIKIGKVVSFQDEGYVHEDFFHG